VHFRLFCLYAEGLDEHVHSFFLCASILGRNVDILSIPFENQQFSNRMFEKDMIEPGRRVHVGCVTRTQPKFGILRISSSVSHEMHIERNYADAD